MPWCNGWTMFLTKQRILRMLHRYTDQERTVVRNNYGQHAMMRLAEIACRLFDNQLQNMSLWAEELFVWAAVIMDDVKEKGVSGEVARHR